MTTPITRSAPPSVDANNQDVFIWALYLLGGADRDVDVASTLTPTSIREANQGIQTYVSTFRNENRGTLSFRVRCVRLREFQSIHFFMFRLPTRPIVTKTQTPTQVLYRGVHIEFRRRVLRLGA